MKGSKRLRGKSWELTVSAGFDINGNRIRETKTLKPVWDEKKKKLVPLSVDEADAELRKFIDEVKGGSYAGRMTVGDYLDYWIAAFIDPEKVPDNAKTYKDKTKRWYKMNVREHLKPHIGHILLRDLNAHDIKKMLTDIAIETGNEKEPIDGIYRTLRAALETAVGVYIDRNPAMSKTARPPRATKRETKAKHQIFNLDQAVRFLETARQQWQEAPAWNKFKRMTIYAIYYTALYQAMRQGEPLGLRWSDLNFDDLIINVRGQLVKAGSNPKFDTPKTEASTRVIRMTKSVSELLQELKICQDVVKAQAEEVKEKTKNAKMNHFAKKWREMKLDIAGIL